MAPFWIISSYVTAAIIYFVLDMNVASTIRSDPQGWAIMGSIDATAISSFNFS